MAVPKRNFYENLCEFLYRRDIIIRSLNRKDFKRRTIGCSLPIGWNDVQNVQVDTKNNESDSVKRASESIGIVSIGQSHIDAAWKWRKEDTRIKKITVTFDRALAHMTMYPEFTYTQNQVIYYDWAKKYYPEMWEGIKQRIKEGRWEAVDGAWVEQDANMPDGESLIRQRLIGQRFYLEEFGFMSDIAWMDDVFGFPHCIPQILAKTNAKYFLTNKFCYNEVNRFPYHTLIWKSPDGSSVLLYWMQHKNNWHHYLKTFKELSILMNEPEKHELNYMSDFEGLKPYIKEKYLPIIGNVYGEGDGGHGPRPIQILEQLCWQKDGYVKLMNMTQFFKILEEYRSQLPIWNDELYLENHQGTLTSIHMIKENNKTAEVLLHNIEYLNVVNVLNKGKNYQSEITEIWKIMLFCQFHDVLPGSSLPEVYRDCAKDYKYCYSELYRIRNEIDLNLKNLQSNEIIKDSFSIQVMNDLSWARAGIITLSLNKISNSIPNQERGNKTIEAMINQKTGLQVVDESGNEYPCQLSDIPFYDANREYMAMDGGEFRVTGSEYLRNQDGENEILSYNCLSENEQDSRTSKSNNNSYLWILISSHLKIPAFGSRILKITPIKDAKRVAQNIDNKGKKIELANAPECIELKNSKISIQIASSTGKIISACLKVNKPESDVTTYSSNCIREIGAVLYKDPATEFDAWNIDPKYRENPVELPPVAEIYVNVDNIDTGNTNPVYQSVLFKTQTSQDGTTYCYRIFLINDSTTLHYEITTDWQEKYKLLKFRVHPQFDVEEIHSGMQYGSIKRVTVPKNRFTDYKAKYEYPNQQWSAVKGKISDTPGKSRAIRVTLLNRNKYGIFSAGSCMELSLLKSAKFAHPTSAATLDNDDPRPEYIDRGFHRLSVAIDITEGDEILEIPEWRAGYEYNFPFNSLEKCMDVSKTSIFDLSAIPDHIHVGAIKMAEPMPKGNNTHPEWFIPETNYDKVKDEKQGWIVVRLAEYAGMEANCDIRLQKSPINSFKNNKKTMTEWIELDMLERINQLGADQDHRISTPDNRLCVKLHPFEIKTIGIRISMD